MTIDNAGNAIPINLKVAIVKGSILSKYFTMTFPSPNKKEASKLSRRPTKDNDYTKVG